MYLTFNEAYKTKTLFISKASYYVYITSDGGHRLRTKPIRKDPYSKCILMEFTPTHNETLFVGTSMITHLCYRNKILPELSEVASFLKRDLHDLESRLAEENMDFEVVDLSFLT